MTRRFRVVTLLVAVVALVAAACGGDDDTAGDGGTGSTNGGDQGASVATVQFTTSDGGSFTLDVTSCDNPGESTVRISAESETASLAVDATDGAGTIDFTSSEGNRQGTVSSAQVGDAGNVSISGNVTPSGGGDESETFEITGQCG